MLRAVHSDIMDLGSYNYFPLIWAITSSTIKFNPAYKLKDNTGLNNITQINHLNLCTTKLVAVYFE